MIIIILIMILIALLTYLIILGGSMNETDEERKLENIEQLEYLKKMEERKNEHK